MLIALLCRTFYSRDQRPLPPHVSCFQLPHCVPPPRLDAHLPTVAESLSYTEIREQLSHGSAAMPDDDLLRFLSSLCLGKQRLILKTPESKVIG